MYCRKLYSLIYINVADNVGLTLIIVT